MLRGGDNILVGWREFRESQAKLGQGGEGSGKEGGEGDEEEVSETEWSSATKTAFSHLFKLSSEVRADSETPDSGAKTDKEWWREESLR
jgi:hypothetical protein